MPCYVNSRLASSLIPVGLRGGHLRRANRVHHLLRHRPAPTLLDINNTVPSHMYEAEIKGKFDYSPHRSPSWASTAATPPSCYLVNAQMNYQRIMKRSLEPDGEPNITRGTWRATWPRATSPSSACRARRTHAAQLCRQGEVLPVATQSFGGIGVFAIPEMGASTAMC